MKTKNILIGLVLLSVILFSGCDNTSTIDSAKTESIAMEQNLQEMNNQVGMPFIQNFFEKRMAKQIFELRDQSDLITYAYMTNLEGKFIYLGKCIGFGLPYSVQYTNPEKLEKGGHSSSYWGTSLPQADPNGLYMPDGLSATWLMLINEETGEAEIIYTEPSIVVTQSKLPKRLVVEWSLPENY